jgi:hypothetical protein
MVGKYLKPLGVFVLGMFILLFVLILTPNSGADYIIYLKAGAFIVALFCILVFVAQSWPKTK